MTLEGAKKLPSLIDHFLDRLGPQTVAGFYLLDQSLGLNCSLTSIPAVSANGYVSGGLNATFSDPKRYYPEVHFPSTFAVPDRDAYGKDL
jgi:hypothetical protein